MKEKKLNLETIWQAPESIWMADPVCSLVPFFLFSISSRTPHSSESFAKAEEDVPVVWSSRGIWERKKKTKIKMLGFQHLVSFSLKLFRLEMMPKGFWRRENNTKNTKSRRNEQQTNDCELRSFIYYLFIFVFSEHDGVPDDLLKVYTGSGCMKVVDSVLTVRTPTATIDFTPNFIGKILFRRREFNFIEKKTRWITSKLKSTLKHWNWEMKMIHTLWEVFHITESTIMLL